MGLLIFQAFLLRNDLKIASPFIDIVRFEVDALGCEMGT